MSLSEGAHVVAGLVTFAFAIGFAASGHLIVGLYFVLMTFLFNAYPIMLQRFNRGRLWQPIANSELRRNRTLRV
jgi:hypothetical protein